MVILKIIKKAKNSYPGKYYTSLKEKILKECEYEQLFPYEANSITKILPLTDEAPKPLE